MRRGLFAISVLLLGAVGFAFGATPGANAQDTTVFGVANGYSHDYDSVYSKKFCIDGEEIVTNETGETDGPFEIESGTHEVTMVDGGYDCTDTPDASTTADFPAGGSVQIFGFWPRGGAEVVVLEMDMSCVEDGTGRVSVANGASVWDAPTESVDVHGTPPGGSAGTLLAGIASGTQMSTDIADGTVNGFGVFVGGTSDQLEIASGALSGSSLDINAGEHLFTYLYGGNDGSIGSFSFSLPLETCQVATTTTTTTSTTAAPAPAASPAQLQPTFTG